MAEKSDKSKIPALLPPRGHGGRCREWRVQAERAVQAREDARRMREGRPASFTAAIGAVYP